MNDQNSQFDNSSNGRETSESYRYVFSNGRPVVQPRSTGGNKRVALAVLTVLLCSCLSFLSGIGGAFLLLSGDSTADEVIGSGNRAPDPSQVHSESPESILSKSGSQLSVYGSAGEAFYAPADVIRAVQDTVVVINVLYPSYMGYTRSSGTGSGVVISETGYILTCNHVVEDAQTIEVVMNSGEVFPATLVGNDADSDLAVIMIDPGERKLAYAKQGCSGDLVVGEHVVAIGNPLGMGLTATTGIISATERRIAVDEGHTMTLLQTDAAINSGNSGGGLFNLNGELIGVVNAKYSASGVEGLAFAIPIDSAYEVEKQLIQYGYVRGIVDHGLTLLEVTQSNLYAAYRQYRINTTGLYVYSSEYTAALQPLDRITAVDGKAIDSASSFEALIKAHAVGDSVALTVVRGTETVNVTLVLREYVPDRLKDTAQ